MVHVPEYTKIGNNCSIFPNVALINEKYPPTPRKVPLTIEDDVIVGSGTVINAGVTLGKGSVIGAGSLVLKDVAPETVVFGRPAHRQYTRDDYEKKRQAFISGQGK
jgi:acetyltransferase-like isoleucine patch superfamily enzyme